MLEWVDVGPRPLEAYLGVAPDGILDELARCAAALRGARVLHVNATPYGGGVSELLRSGVPLLNDLGLVVIRGDDRTRRDHAARDRPAQSQEHAAGRGDLTRRARVDRRRVEPAARQSGVPLRGD